MSRIIVKNLPSIGVKEEDLKKQFSEIDTVTDVKLKHNDFGEFRRFAFVGFKNQDAAERAIEQLNNTFIRSNRITLEVCKSMREIKPDRINTKVNSKSNEYENKLDCQTKNVEKKEKKFQDPFDEVKDDPKFNEFLSLQRNIDPKIKSKYGWSDEKQLSVMETELNDKNNINGEGVGDTDKVEKVDEGKKKPHKRSRGKKKKLNDKSGPKELFEFTVKVKGFPQEYKRKDVKEFFKPLELRSIRICKKDELCYVSFVSQSDLNFAMRKNNHFAGTKRIRMIKHNVKRSKKFQIALGEKAKEKEEMFRKYEQSLANIEDLSDSGRLFIRNLNYTCTQQDIEDVFLKFGPITEIHFPVDKKSMQPKGFAFVEFQYPEHAKKAYDELNGSIFQGRNFHLIPSKPKPNLEPSLQALRYLNPDASSSKFKVDKLSKQVVESSRGSNWNILFLDPNAVANAGALAENIDKSSFLTKQGSKKSDASIAVRMALADASIVDETRKFLVSNGIELDSFDNPLAPRSKTVILVKNLSGKVTRSELELLFGEHGQVARVLLPPSGLTGIVEMEDATEAKLAFRKLAYLKNKAGNILYLEWAPINVFRENNLEEQERKDTEQLVKLQTGTKIVVKNIPFEATQKEVAKLFATFGELKFVRFVKKIDGQHRGFCFVDFISREGALRAFSSLCHSTHLYGRKLVLEWAKLDPNDTPANV